MKDWNQGYVSDHTYDNYYFNQLAPRYLQQLLLLSGMDLPSRDEGVPMRYLELGYGQGISLNIHAATEQEAEFWGTDFLPEQALNARTLSLQANLGTRALNYSFAEFDELAQVGRLPAFDIIVMHGIWSWINAENRQHILNIIRNTLRPGGIIYISYNAMPGRSTLMPVRELMAIHAEIKGAGKDSLTRATEAARFACALSDGGASFFSDNPVLKPFMEKLMDHSPVYLAHEYLNRNWQSFYFADVARDMASVGCSFAISTRPLESLAISQPEDTRDFLNAIPNPVARETLQDFNLNQGFRPDIFVREGQYLPSEVHEKHLDSSFFAMKVPLEQIETMIIQLPLSKATLDKNIYNPIMEVLAENQYEPKSLAFLRRHPRLSGMKYEELLFYIRILLGGSYISPAQPTPSGKTVAACQRLNRILCEMTLKGEIQEYLASPVLGCGITILEHFQLFLLLDVAGKKDPESWAVDTQAILNARQKSLQVETPQGMKTGLEAFLHEANYFKNTILPYLKAMGVMPAPPQQT